MSGFEFAFSLLGLLLGLSVAELLGGLARSIKRRRRTRVGLLTPLLATFLLLDLTSTWMSAWNSRARLEQVTYAAMVVGLIYAGTYYVVAALIYPDETEEWDSLDAYYLVHRRFVAGALSLLNFGALLLITRGRVAILPPSVLALQVTYYAAMAVILATRRRTANLLALLALIGVYGVATGMDWAQVG